MAPIHGAGSVDVDTSELDALLVFPPWQCDHQGTPGGVRSYEAVGFFVTGERIATNSFYAARTPTQQWQYHCNTSDFEGSVSTRYLYLVSAGVSEAYHDAFEHGFAVRPSGFDDGSVIYVPKDAIQ